MTSQAKSQVSALRLWSSSVLLRRDMWHPPWRLPRSESPLACPSLLRIEPNSGHEVSSPYRYKALGCRSRPARVLAALANVVAVLVVEAGAPVPLALRLALVALGLAMMVPVVARGADDRKGDEPDRDTRKKAAAMTGFGMLYGGHSEARRQDAHQTGVHGTPQHRR